MSDFVCEQCGRCCIMELKLNLRGLDFVSPAPYFMCKHLNLKTNKCMIHDGDRPENCKNFNCGGKHEIQKLEIKGVKNVGNIDRTDTKTRILVAR